MLRKFSSLTMPKKVNKTASTEKQITENKTNSSGCVFNDKKGNIVLKIAAKPGAKSNQITDISDESIGIQINAPPVDGEANTELIKFLSSILGVRKSDLSLDRGSKSRQKTVILEKGCSSIDSIKEKLRISIKQL